MTDSIDLASMNSLKAATAYTSTHLHEAVKLRMGKQHGLAATAPQIIPKFFRECCQKFAQHPALVYESTPNKAAGVVPLEDSKWVTITYAEYEQQVEQAALMLLHIGLQPRSSVGILAFNCPEWFYAEMGALRAGGVVAGIYPSNSAEAVHHVLDTSEATVCIVDDAAQMAKVRSIKSRLPRLGAVVQLNGPFEEFVGVENGYYRWQDLAKMQFGEALRNELVSRENDVAANECALLIYTSGTVGMPKAVMLSHDSIIYNAKAVNAALPDICEGEEVALTYLPLSHIAAQVFDIYLILECGGCLYFADRNALKGTLTRTMRKARPTRFFGVPRIFEKIQENLLAAESKSSALSKCLLQAAREITKNHYVNIMEGKPNSSLKYWLASRITNKIQCSMGLDRCKSFIIGGAPVRNELKNFFFSLDIFLNEVYGMSEMAGCISLHLDHSKLGSAGKPLEGVELKVYNPNKSGQGEICIRSRMSFMGYLGEENKTKETIKDDGWFHSGDLGYLDTEGNLIISGRIKELIITAGGENIPPAHIEALIKRELPGISNAMVVGDHRKYLTVLLTIKTDLDAESGLPLDKLSAEAVEWMVSLGLDYTLLSEVLNIPSDIQHLDASNIKVTPDEKVLESIQEGIKRANQHSISNAQKVQKFSVLPHDFTIPTSELGPTLKIRRNIVHQKYDNIIAAMYK